MNFDLSSEQQMLKDSVDRFVEEHYSLEQRQTYTRLKGGFERQHWQTMAELGWLGLPFNEADGGYGGTEIDIMLIMESFGRGLVVEPYLASIVLAGGLIARDATDTLKDQLLPEIIAGNKLATLAFAEQQSRFDLDNITTLASLNDGEFTVNGQKSMVINGGTADHLITSVRTQTDSEGAAGISLLVIDPLSDGVTVTPFPTVDGLQAAEVKFQNVQVPAQALVGDLHHGFARLQSAVMHGTIAICAEAVGAMEMLYKDTTTYIQEREQFDHPLASFQVLRHRMVDMFMEYEQAKSLLFRATLEVQQQGLDAQRTVHALKHFIGKTGITIGEHAVQSHGGMGMTEELRIGHYFKRLLVIDTLFGNTDYHLEQFARAYS